MPKSPKIGRNDRPRHNSLAQDYSPYQSLKQKAPKKRKHTDDENGQTDTVIDSRSSRKILNLGQGLASEDKAESQARYVSARNDAFATDPRLGFDVEDESEDDDDAEAWEDEEDEEMETEVLLHA
jgi:essential nuclear protein 1